MGKGVKGKGVSLGLVTAILIFFSPQVLKGQISPKGNLLGFVYGQDGTTPLPGAVVMVKNISSGKVYESAASDGLGVFKVQGLETGLYALGVVSPDGSYNSTDLVGVAANETAKIAIALNPYEKDVREAVQSVNKDQQQKGESRIGPVTEFMAGSGRADVFIERGLLQAGDRIHVKGASTDFYQDAKGLIVQGASVRKALVGESCSIILKQPCVASDIVYVVCKRGIPPFFLAPLGIAAVIAGSAALTTGGEEQTASPFKN
ncbi:MAG TPA: carboxypeptidase-like regulatory domain-containing protein [Acidobacteriota bacterium]|nr:carboxypeptidase-like regulatory domain-containing protein [Acidobacteriota bacterium]